MDRTLGRKIWLTTFLILGIGLCALYSASYDNVRVSQKIFYDQLGMIVLGLIVMAVLSRIDYRRFYDAAYIFFGLTIILLLLVLFSGHKALGARRWLQFAGINFQPSEIMKLSLILMLGRYFSDRRPNLSFNWVSRIGVLWRDVLLPLFLTMIPMFLIFKQPDLGTALLIFGIFLLCSLPAKPIGGTSSA